MHTPSHSLVPGGQVQVPWPQVFPPRQCLPHPPQFVGSVRRSVQAVPQRSLFGGQAVTQALAEQTSVILQAPLQFPPQAFPLLHTHLPCSQCESCPQATPQAPQWRSSVFESTQAPPGAAGVWPQGIWPPGQTQLPPAHSLPEGYFDEAQ